MRLSRSLPVLVLVAVVIAACEGAPPVYQPSESPVPVARSGDFTLAISSPRTTWALGTPISVSATLTYDGAGPTTVIGAGAGLVSFGVREIGGTREMAASFTYDAVPYEINPGEPIVADYVKSGGWDPRSDPNTAFYEDYFADSEFRLPAGQWEITAWTRFATEEGGPYSVDMTAGLVLNIE